MDRDTRAPTIAQIRHPRERAEHATSPRVRALHARIARDRIAELRALLDVEERALDALEGAS